MIEGPDTHPKKRQVLQPGQPQKTVNIYQAAASLNAAAAAVGLRPAAEKLTVFCGGAEITLGTYCKMSK